MSKEDGKVDIMITDEASQVIMRFKEPMQWIAMDPENAATIGEAIAKAGYKARYGKAPTEGTGSAITKEIRDRLVTTTIRMLVSMTDQKKDTKYQAQQIVDHVLSRVA